MISLKTTTLLISSFLLASYADFDNGHNIVQNQEGIQSSSKVLSRRKRFLIFPDGSSFQLVFCAQNQGYLQIGDIVWFGNTAALAWELPSDPSLFYKLKEKTKHGNSLRRQDTKHVIYLDEDGKVISTVPYRRKYIVNPAFAKRSIESNRKPISIKEMHEMQKNRSYLYELDAASIEFHRTGRKSFYEKLETFFKGLGYSGKECVLRLLCESSKPKINQGTFLEEIMTATFTFPQSSAEPDDRLEYDDAHQSSGDCSQLYSECEDLHGHLLGSQNTMISS